MVVVVLYYVKGNFGRKTGKVVALFMLSFAKAFYGTSIFWSKFNLSGLACVAADWDADWPVNGSKPGLFSKNRFEERGGLIPSRF